MKIVIDDLSGPAVRALLEEHLDDMHALSPPGSVHVLDLERLRHPSITFWTAWDDTGAVAGASAPVLLGCGALKLLAAPEQGHGEIKSMRTPLAWRGRGAGRAVLAHIVAAARARGLERLSLETGAAPAFRPAHRLYESAGFAFCGPFGGYLHDPNSVFMTLRL